MNRKINRKVFCFLLACLLLGSCVTSCRRENRPQKLPAEQSPSFSAGTIPTPTPAKTNSRGMAVLRIETEDKQDILSKEEYVKCTVSAENCEEAFRFTNAEAGIRIRGNSTAGAEKKPYRLRFEQKQTLLGLNNNAECKNWCLMADYFDPSMMRTATTFRLGRTLLEGNYFCSDSTYAELYLNGRYHGVYLVCEQSQINKNRISIFEKAEQETGTAIGYLLIGQGGRSDEPNTVYLHASVPVTDLNGDSMYCGSQIFSLSGGDYTESQIQFIADWCTAVYQAVHAALYNNRYYTVDQNCRLQPKTDLAPNLSREEKQQETIGALIDLESAVRMYLLDEIIKDLDSGTFNMYVDLSPTGTQKLTFAAPWDFDFALGNTKYDTTFSPEGLYAANFSYSDGVRTNSWYIMLNKADWFRERVRTVWNEKYSALKADAEAIPELSKAYENEFARNYRRWDLLGKQLLFHQHDNVLTFKTQQDAADFLYHWLSGRLEWLNREWGC